MEQRTWSWRRKASEKFITANGRVSLSLETNAGEDQYTETGSNRCPSNLSERLSSVLCDCAAKEEQGFTGQQIAEAEITFLKQELDKALQQRAVADQRLTQLDHNLLNTTNNFENMQKKFENKITELNRRVSNLTSENSNLMKALLCKEKQVDDLDKGKLQLEDELDRLLAKLDSTMKENTYLKYNCNVLEEELKLRDEERKYNHRLSLDNAKQINSLEVECQQLKDLIRKRLADPTIGMNVRKVNKGTGFLIERVYDLEKENKTLREMLTLMDGQLREQQSMQLVVSGFGVDKTESERWANALLTELEQFRRVRVGDEPECRELEVGPMNAESRTSWLDEVLKVMLEEHRVSKRSFGELLSDIKIVVGCCKDDVNQEEGSKSNIRGLLPWKSLTSDNYDISIRKHLGFDRSTSDDKLNVPSNRGTTLGQMIQIQSTEESERVVSPNAELKKQLQQSNKEIEELRQEVGILRETNGVIEEQIENQRLINEDLDTQLTVARGKLNEILHKLSSLEVELEDKNNSCEELEATCLELQLQLETISRHNSPSSNKDQQAKESGTEMIQTSENNMNNTLVSPGIKAPVSDAKSPERTRSSLLDRMMEDNDDQTRVPMSPNTTEKPSNINSQTPPSTTDDQKIKNLTDIELKTRSPAMAVVPSKKSNRGFGFIRRMFLRRKKGCSKMKPVSLRRNASALIGPRNVVVLV